MALVATSLGEFPPRMGNSPINTASAFTFDGSADSLALIFRVPVNGTLDNVHYRVVSDPGTLTATIRVELRTVDVTTGFPSAAGTLYGSSTSITKAVTLGDTIAANTNYAAAVAATAMVAGETAAIVLDFSAYTTGSYTSMWVPGQPLIGSPAGRVAQMPYCVTNTGAGQALDTNVPDFLLEYSGGVFVPIDGYFQWLGTRTAYTVTTSGTTRRGNKFTPVTPRRAVGFYVAIDLDDDILLQLRLASDDSVLATATLDKDIKSSISPTQGWYRFDATGGAQTTVNLTAGTAYYVLATGAGATGSIIYAFEGMPSNSALAACPGGINNFGVAYAGTYTETNTSRYDIGLITDREDDGTGSGGGLLTNPGMGGGMRG